MSDRSLDWFCSFASADFSGSRSLAKMLLTLAALLALLPPMLPAAAQTPPETVAEPTRACAPCHGAQGEGTRDSYFPRLAGKPAGYLFIQLVAFRNGRRHYPPMNYLLEHLPKDYLKEMAEYFASLDPPLPPPAEQTVSNEVLGHGQALVSQAMARATSRPA